MEAGHVREDLSGGIEDNRKACDCFACLFINYFISTIFSLSIIELMFFCFCIADIEFVVVCVCNGHHGSYKRGPVS